MCPSGLVPSSLFAGMTRYPDPLPMARFYSKLVLLVKRWRLTQTPRIVELPALVF
jgi:hypothetical protein